MMTYCCYADCSNKYLPCTSIAFFKIPGDHRRPIWIENSGNPELAQMKPTSVKHVCEKHFNPKYFRRQFSRTILHKDAVPYKYDGRQSRGRSLCVAEESGQSETSNDISLQKLNVTKYQVPKYRIQSVTQKVIDEKDTYKEEYSEITDICEQDMINLSDTKNDEAAEPEEFDDNSVIESLTENVGYVGGQEERHEEDERDEEAEHDEEDERVEDEEHDENYLQDSPRQYFPKNNKKSRNDYEEDKHFALSLVGHFQRLPLKTKSIAKLKIMQYLMELEFDNASSALG